MMDRNLQGHDSAIELDSCKKVPPFYITILGFHSRDKQPCFLTETKKRICIKIEFNFRNINWGSNMAVVSLFRGSNMAAVTSGENQEL